MPLANPKTCKAEGCHIREKSRGYCFRHWRMSRNDWAEHCRVIDCRRVPHGQGLCRPHYDAHRKGYDIGIGPGMFGVFGRTSCEECNEEPMGGGRWCLHHFHEYIEEQDALDPSRRVRRDPIRCGTQRGRERHKRRGEPLCGPCEADAYEWIERMTRAS